MSKKRSSDPVVRAEAELEEAMETIKAYTEAMEIPPEPDEGSADDGAHDDGQGQDDGQQPEPLKMDRQQDDENSETYKSRWLSLQGQFRSMQNQMQELNRHNQQLIADIERIKLQTASQQPAAGGDVTSGELESVAARVAEQYGDELGKPFEQLVKYVRRLEGEVQTTRQQASQIAQTTESDKRDMYLTQLCPQWQQLNYDDSFIAWLGQKAPYTNKTLQQVLNAAYESGDMEGTAEIFNGFLREQNKPKAQEKPDSRASLQTPTGRTSSAAPQQNQQKMWTEREVDAFYRSIQNGTFRGTTAEKAATESEIHLAYLEGRVR